jgi:spermidine/putrescine transport system substrate-binding protein
MEIRKIQFLAAAIATCVIPPAVYGDEAVKQEVLNILNWDDYIDQQIVVEFEKENNCKIVLDTIESSEDIINKLQDESSKRYDIVVPSDFMLQTLVNQGLLAQLDHSLIPNIANLKDQFVNPSYDKGNTHSVPYQWGTVGIVYSKAKFVQPVTSWKSIFEPVDGVKFILLDSQREMLAAAMRYQGHSINSFDKQEMKNAATMLAACRKKAGFAGFEGNSDGIDIVMAGKADIAVAYNGDALQKMADNDNIAFATPKEGSILWVDNLCIPKNSANPALAHKFINFILDAKIGAQLSNYTHYATPNKASTPMINADDLANPCIYPNEETMKNLEILNEQIGCKAMYDQLWKIVKTR